jgi:hypothetical protein
MMTADEALIVVSTTAKLTTLDRVYLHASHAQNANDSQLRLSLHVQLGDEENWQDSNGEIAKRGKCTVDICHDDNDVDTDAVTFDRGVQGGSGPEVRQRLAL